MEQYDLVVIGGGAGGLVAALGGARLGAKTALIEKKRLGGDCLHYGCVPTKTLIYSAKVYSLIHRAEEFGVGPAQAELDFKKVIRRMREIQARIGEQDKPENFEKQGIKVICDKKGTLLGAHVLGPNGGELLHEFTVAKKNRLKIGRLSSTIHAYPTLAQAVRKSADQFYTEKLFKGPLPRLARLLVRLSR